MKESKILSEQEVETILLALAAGHKPRGFTEDQAMHVIRWAERVRVDHQLLENILNGIFAVEWRDSDISFRVPGESEASK